MIVTVVLLVVQNGKANHMSGNKNKILNGDKMEFASKEEMFAYEKARENYYINFFNTRSIFGFYKLLLKEIFIPKYRNLKKEYDNYTGGWWRDEKGFIHAQHIWYIDLNKVANNSICITDYDEIYVLDDDCWHRIY